MRLPPHYVPRPRLTARCSDAPVVVVEAAAGYGKSVLGVELVAIWGAVPVTVVLERDEVPAPLLVARLRAAVAAAGYTAAAAAAVESGEDSVGAVDAMVAALAAEQIAFIIDDAHEAAPDAAALLERLASGVTASQHLVVLARTLPLGGERLRRAEYVHLDAADLALDDAETLELCRRGFGLDVTVSAADTLRGVTGGWTAATVLAASRVARTGGRVEDVIDMATSKGGLDAVRRILDETVASMGGAHHAALAQVARLPLLDVELVDGATGVDGLFATAIARGLPFAPATAPWWDLPGPVRERLAALAPADPEVLRRAADAYVDRGETRVALELLIAAGDPDTAARVLAAMPPALVETLDATELVTILDRLPADALDAHPGGLLHASRSLRVATRFDESNDLVGRVRAVGEATGDDALLQAVDAEGAWELLRQLRTQDAEVAARRVLDEAPAQEALTRTRALHVLAQSLCWREDASGHRDEQALDEAAACFERCVRGYRDLGMPSAAAAVVPYWAINIEFARGHARRALEMLDEALVESAGVLRRRAFIQVFRGWVTAELGLDDVCRDSLDEVLRVATTLKSDLFVGLASWKLAILTSYRGDADTTLELIRTVELHRAGWWSSGSGDFLAEAADLLDRVGHVTLAREYLERVTREPKDVAHLVALSAAVLEARHGDPVHAVRLIDRAEAMRIDPRECWRLTLLRAYAAFRAGHPSAGGLAARAFEQVAAIGQPMLPLLKESELTEQLLGLAVETGQPAALALQASSSPRHLTLLGSFAITVAGRATPLPRGQGVQLLKVVALHRRIPVELVIASLWPEADLETGRNRLRTVLNRLRTDTGDLVEREGEVLALALDVTVDLEQFDVEVRRVLALRHDDAGLAASVARGAMARYHGELLPDDRYEGWVEEPRERARRGMLDLLALCADEAGARGDLDEVRRLVVRAIEVDPYDDHLYVRAATVLVDHGRRGEALSVLRRARVALGELGLDVPAALESLETQAREDGDRR